MQLSNLHHLVEIVPYYKINGDVAVRAFVLFKLTKEISSNDFYKEVLNSVEDVRKSLIYKDKEMVKNGITYSNIEVDAYKTIEAISGHLNANGLENKIVTHSLESTLRRNGMSVGFALSEFSIGVDRIGSINITV
jgi:precorrin isomerase